MWFLSILLIQAVLSKSVWLRCDRRVTKVDRVGPMFKGVIHLHVRSDMSGDTLDTITARVWATPKYLTVCLKIVWMGSFQYAWIRKLRSSPLSLRQQKADMMRHDFSLLLGNSIIYPRYKKNKRERRWLWLVLAAAVLAVTALGFVGA